VSAWEEVRETRQVWELPGWQTAERKAGQVEQKVELEQEGQAADQERVWPLAERLAWHAVVIGK